MQICDCISVFQNDIPNQRTEKDPVRDTSNTSNTSSPTPGRSIFISSSIDILASSRRILHIMDAVGDSTQSKDAEKQEDAEEPLSSAMSSGTEAALEPEQISASEEFETSLKRLISQHTTVALGDPSKKERSATWMMKSLLGMIHLLQDEVDKLGKSFEQGHALPPRAEPKLLQADQRYLVLHRVFCDKADHCHNKVVYEDKPAFDNDRGWGFDQFLRGNVPIFSVGTLLSQRPTVHFVVFKEYSCSSGNLVAWQEPSQELRGPDHISARRERICIVSRTLHEALVKVARFQPYSRVPSLANAKEMDAPYPFLFYHQEALRDLAGADATYQESLEVLLAYLSENYEGDYSEAREMFSRGMVSSRHLGKLFQPGRLVVAGRRPKSTSPVIAGVATHCELSAEGGVSLEGWRWSYNGTRLERVHWSACIDAISEEPSLISDLAICPLEFAPAAVVKVLETRGRKFWDMRYHKYCARTDVHNRVRLMTTYGIPR